MGTKARRRPKRLGEKLLQVRLAFGVSQNEMIRRLGVEDFISQNTLSSYELGNREPSLLIILAYARAAGLCADVLIDDEMNLPAKLPAKPKHS